MGITMVEKGGTIEATRISVVSGELSAAMARKKLPSSNTDSGVVTFWISSCRDTSEASAAKRQA